MILCKEQFQNDWGAVSMGYSAYDKLPPKFSDFLIAHSSAEVSQFIEEKIWNGGIGADSFEGLVPQLGAAGSGAVAVAAVAGGIDAANVITELGRVVDAIPTAVYGKEDLHLYLPQGVARAYVRALGGFFEGQLVFYDQEFESRARKMVGDDIDKIWTAKDLCTSDDTFFIASGVCTGWVPGVEFVKDKAVVTSKIIFGDRGEVKLITNEYNLGGLDV